GAHQEAGRARGEDQAPPRGHGHPEAAGHQGRLDRRSWPPNRLGRMLMTSRWLRTFLAVAVLLPAAAARAQAPAEPRTYAPAPASLPPTGFPKGQLVGPIPFKSRILEGTVRRYWVYVPAQYKPAEPAN